VALLSKTQLKPHERFCIRNYHIYRNDRQPGAKCGTAVAVRKVIPHNYVQLPPLISVEATGTCIPIEIKKSYLRQFIDLQAETGMTKTSLSSLSLRNKPLVACDLNAKNPVWKNRVLNISGTRLLNLQENSDFKISVPRYTTHYAPSGNGNVLDKMVHRKVHISDINMLGILDSYHLPILFHILNHVSTRGISAPAEIHTDWERFQSLASDFISPRIQIRTVIDAERTACNFRASIASVYRLSTHKITLSKLYEELPELDRLLQLKRRLRELWQKTGDRHVKRQ
jgi:hypothetical protein